MRAEVVDSIRRELRADLLARLTDVPIELAEQIAGDAGALMDSLLVGFEASRLDGRDAAVVGQFVFTVAWPRILAHALPWAALARGADARTVDRLRAPRVTVAAKS